MKFVNYFKSILPCEIKIAKAKTNINILDILQSKVIIIHADSMSIIYTSCFRKSPVSVCTFS